MQKTAEGDSKEDILDNLRRGFEDMESYNEGKLKTKPARDFLK